MQMNTNPRANPRGNGAGMARSGAALLLALAFVLLPAPGLAQGGGVPKANPRLASLNIEIWPEYDRPAALVILRAALAESVKLPATVTLKLPAASGGPSAVAHSTAADGNLLSLNYDRAKAGEFITVKFETPSRFFHVEFYEPIPTPMPRAVSAMSGRATWRPTASRSSSRSPHLPQAFRWSPGWRRCPPGRTDCITAWRSWARSKRASSCRSPCITPRPMRVPRWTR